MRIVVLAFAIVAMSVVATPLPAFAQAPRTFVSSYGDDGNPCSRQAPCRSFATAITRTAAGGEINTLDPGGYGAFTVTKSISIVSGLGEAGVLVPAGGIGITINAGPNDQVNLRGLAVEGAGTGTTGVRFNTGGSLTITNCVLRNMTENALDLEPSGSSTFTIADTLVSDNGRVGVYIYPQGNNGVARGALTRVVASHNQWGIYANGNATPAISGMKSIDFFVSNSTIVHNTKGDGIGLFLDSGVNGFAKNTQLFVGNTSFSGNTTSALIKYGELTASASQFGEGIRCGTNEAGYVISYGNNVIIGSDPSNFNCLLPGRVLK